MYILFAKTVCDRYIFVKTKNPPLKFDLNSDLAGFNFDTLLNTFDNPPIMLALAKSTKPDPDRLSHSFTHLPLIQIHTQTDRQTDRQTTQSVCESVSHSLAYHALTTDSHTLTLTSHSAQCPERGSAGQKYRADDTKKSDQ